MNKKIIIIFILTIIALVVLWLYSFGPLAGTKVAKVNPESLKTVSQQNAISGQSIIFNIYHNKDLTENFYTIKFPQSWQLQIENSAGSYHFVFDKGNGSAELQDVSDNTTLELFVLSQEEPKLKKTLNNYVHLDYKKTSVNNNDAYQLIYQSAINNKTYKTIETYITGQDHAAVITLSSEAQNFADFQQIFYSILNSFQWEK
jgi:hypothetical protein